MIQKRLTLLLCISLFVLGNALPLLAQDGECTLTAEDYRTEGIAQYQANDVAGAIASFTCVVELDPEDAVAYNNLGFFYGLTGDADSALANYAIAEELDPTYVLTFVNRGDVYVQLGQYEDAISDLETAFELNPDGLNPLTYNNWGTALYFTGQIEDAIEKYTSAIEGNPEYPDALNNRGFSYIEAGEYSRALSDFRQALSLTTELPISYLGLGDASYANGLGQPALDAYTTYISMTDNPAPRAAERITELEGILAQPEAECTLDTDLDGYLGAGNQALQRGTLDVAVNLYSCAIQEFSDEAMGYNNRGFAHLQSGALDFALSDLSQAVVLDPELAMAYANRGQTLYALRDYQGAIDDLQISIDLDDSASNVAYASTGFVYAEIGAYETALPYLITAANSINGNLDALSNMAYAYYQLGRYEESFLAFEQLAVSMNRDNFPANIEALAAEVEELTEQTIVSAKIACDIVTTGGTSAIARDFKVDGNQLLGEGDFEGAVEKFNCAIEMNPFDSYAYNNRALAEYQMGEYELALATYAKSLELNPWDAQTYSNRGYLYVETGELELALADFNTALGYDPEHGNALYGRADAFAKMGEYEAAKADLDTLIPLLGANVPDVVSELIADVESNLE